jgi:uncharacterized membrane protein YsdA (DUF1294 family)
VVTLVLLLALPVFALTRLAAGIDGRVLAGVPLALSMVAFFAYRSDKRRAEAGAWRIPESTLHLLGLLGGWPGAFLAQRIFRHKNSKASFQLVFWTVVLLHEYLALDALLDWRFTRRAIQFVSAQTV